MARSSLASLLGVGDLGCHRTFHIPEELQSNYLPYVQALNTQV